MFPVVPTISESSGIPKEKNYPQPRRFELRPLFTGQLFIVAQGLLRQDSRDATAGPGWHAHQPMVCGLDNRHGAADSTAQIVPFIP